MKAILEFNLPDDKIEYEIANKAQAYHTTLWEIDQYMRNTIKHGNCDFKDKEIKTVEKLRKIFLELMQEADIKFD